MFARLRRTPARKKSPPKLSVVETCFDLINRRFLAKEVFSRKRARRGAGPCFLILASGSHFSLVFKMAWAHGCPHRRTESARGATCLKGAAFPISQAPAGRHAAPLELNSPPDLASCWHPQLAGPGPIDTCACALTLRAHVQEDSTPDDSSSRGAPSQS